MKKNEIQAFDNIPNVDTNQFMLAVVHRVPTGERRAIVLPRAAKSEPRELYRALLNNGADVPKFKDFEPTLIRALERADSREWKIHERAGWCGRDFLTEHRTYSRHPAQAPAHHLRRVQAVASKKFNRDGFLTLRSRIKEICEHSSFATFAVSAGFAGPVLKLVGLEEGAAFYFYSITSTGKSSVLVMAASARGNISLGKLPSFDMTERRMEEFAVANNDGTVVLDELGRLPGGDREDVVARFAYKMASGMGRLKSTSKQVQTAFPDLEWKTVLVLSGEIDIDAYQARTGQSGQKARLIQIPVPPRKAGGIFDRLPMLPFATRKRLLTRMVQAAKGHDGFALDQFLSFLVNHRSVAINLARATFERFLEKCGVGQDPFARRRAEKFALIAAAGELAIRANVLGLRPGSAVSAALQVYSRCNVAAGADFSVLVASRTLFAKLHDAALFPRVSKGQSFPNSTRAVGLISKEGGEEYAFVDSRQLDAVLEGEASGELIKALIEEGIALPPPSKRNTPFVQKMVKGYPTMSKRPSFLKVSLRRLKEVALTHRE